MERYAATACAEVTVFHGDCHRCFPRNSVLATRVALHVRARAMDRRLSVKAIMRRQFRALTRTSPAMAKVVEALRELALPAIAILAASQDAAQKPRLREQTERARELGIFGAPTFSRRQTRCSGATTASTMRSSSSRPVRARPLARDRLDGTSASVHTMATLGRARRSGGGGLDGRRRGGRGIAVA